MFIYSFVINEFHNMINYIGAVYSKASESVIQESLIRKAHYVNRLLSRYQFLYHRFSLRIEIPLMIQLFPIRITILP